MIVNKNALVLRLIFFVLIFQDILEEVTLSVKYFDDIFSFCVFLFGVYVLFSRDLVREKKEIVIMMIGLCFYNLCGSISSYVEGDRNFVISFLSQFLSNKFFLTMIGIYILCTNSDFMHYLALLKDMIRPMMLFVAGWHVVSTCFFYDISFSVLELCAKTVFLVSLIFMDWRGEKDWLYILIALMLLLSTGRAKAFGAILIMFIIIIWILKCHKKITIFGIVFTMFGAVLVAWDKIYNYYIYGVEGEFPRAMLMKYGAIVACQRFPFGTGWGTFGTHYAAEYYSPVYVELGWENHYTLGVEKAGFLNDTYWPTVYCETGWIGFAFFVVALIFIFIMIQKQYKLNCKMYAAGFLCFAYMLVTTLESTAYANPSVLVLAVTIGIVLANDGRGKGVN